MAVALRAPCRVSTCPAFAERAGYCVAHTVEHARGFDRSRGTPAQRGYDADWRRFRSSILAQRPVCQDCDRDPAREVHHLLKVREYPSLRLAAGNVLALCKACHSARTLRGE